MQKTLQLGFEPKSAKRSRMVDPGLFINSHQLYPAPSWAPARWWGHRGGALNQDGSPVDDLDYKPRNNHRWLVFYAHKSRTIVTIKKKTANGQQLFVMMVTNHTISGYVASHFRQRLLQESTYLDAHNSIIITTTKYPHGPAPLVSGCFWDTEKDTEKDC